jgi:multidrug efflux pump subunit AcrB/ABC-type multidrug transport system ATPase subunit
MNIIKFIINRKTFISMLFIGMTLLGYISYKQLPIELLPNAELPFLIVNVSSTQEINPEYMESQAIIPLEGAIGTLEGIDELQSFAERRRGTIIVYYNQGVKLKYAYLRLQEKVNEIKSNIPEEFRVDVLKVDTEQLSNQFMGLEVRGSGGTDRLRNIVDQEIITELENIDGVVNAEVFGGREKSVEIILDEETCRAYNITPSQIQALIRSNNAIKAFVGQVKGDRGKYFVNVLAEYTEVSDLENITVRQNGPILLKDIADIYVGTKEETSLSRVNGKEAITVQLVRDTQVNLIQLSHTTRQVINRLNNELKLQDIEIVIQSDLAEDMENNIDLIIELAIIGAILAVIILWIFLRNLRLVVIITLAIPISVFTAFNFFYAFNISLNSLTLVGMALAVGMLLDNSIVVLENIYRRMALSRDYDTSVILGTSEVWRSIVAGTLTTITVFLPFIFSSNFLVKLLGRHVGVSIISTLLVSLAVALMLIPTLTHFFLQRKGESDQANFQIVSQKNRLLQIYTVLLKSTIRFPARTIILTVVAFFATVIICIALSLNVTQEVETNEFDLYVTMSSGATLEATNLVVEDLEARLEDLKEKEDIISKIYEEEAIVTVKLKEDFEKIEHRTLPQIKNSIEERIDDIRVAEVSFEQPTSSSRFRGGGGANPGGNFQRMMGIGTQQERIVIKGRDFNRMRAFADDIQFYLEDLSTMNRVRMNLADNRPEIHLHFDPQIISYYDISLNAIRSELASFQNEFSSGLNYKQGTDEYDIVIRMAEMEEDKTIDDLRQLQIPDNSGVNHEMDEISQIIYSSGMSGINRVNQEKQIEINYQFLSEVNDSKELLESARAEVDELIANINIPSGIAIEVVHEESELEEFYFLIGAAFILIFMILASVFESLATPVVMMFTIPLAAMGSFIALILTGNSLLNANTLIGFLILLGVVVNNGIILIDYTRILRQRGFRRSRALMVAGQARIRPILITAITTIVAMFPLAMGRAEYVTQIGAPFAITVIGGLSLSTLFTLVFIPTVYSGLESALQWFAKLNWKIKTIQAIFFVLGCWEVYSNVNSVIWQFFNLFLLVMVIPGLTYFIMASLRQAKTEIIKKDEPIIIKIQNLVKIYDRESRFVREWNKGKREKEREKQQYQVKEKPNFENLLWELPLFVFLIYFIYFYMQSKFWLFVLSHLVYFFVFYLYNATLARMDFSTKPKVKKWIQHSHSLFLWGFPLFNLILFYLRWKNIAIVIFIAFLWYLALMIYNTSNKLHREKINIARLSGKFTKLRWQFYRFVGIIPILGKKRNPFRALNGVSIQIGKGMFGLLGPNGAGKTTLMRIICGILEQSYGKIWMNGLDVNENREELQGLIGYLPQEFGSYENMTAYEFLNYQAILKNILKKEEREKIVETVLKSVHMVEHKDQKIGSFSGGMKQRIGIAQILLHLPRILVVDEPTAGLDPRERIRFRNLLVELSRDRIVIFSTHIIEDISSSCNKVAVMNRGNLVYLGEPTHMTDTAVGHVWQFHIAAHDFEQFRKEQLIVHHMRDGERIRVRCLSQNKPHPDAENVRPTLEDAYIWLIRKEREQK